jgi:ribosomal protein S18 acetylase RimI-like enzyme
VSYEIRALDDGTWACFADLVERHRGVWGGCWCMGFHAEGVGKDTTYELNRERKRARVGAGTTHAALVLDGDTCIGWCQYGSTDELPRIKHRKAYDAIALDPPDWRITCFFVDSAHRRRGVAEAALAGALALIAQAGGGVVESYPEDTTDRKVSSSFLHNATVSMFEAQGFERVRRIGKDRLVVRRAVIPSR